MGWGKDFLYVPFVGFCASNRLLQNFQGSSSFRGDGTHDSRVPGQLEKFSLLSETNQSTSTSWHAVSEWVSLLIAEADALPIEAKYKILSKNVFHQSNISNCFSKPGWHNR
jgi:hypothetical protein